MARCVGLTKYDALMESGTKYDSDNDSTGCISRYARCDFSPLVLSSVPVCLNCLSFNWSADTPRRTTWHDRRESHHRVTCHVLISTYPVLLSLRRSHLVHIARSVTHLPFPTRPPTVNGISLACRRRDTSDEPRWRTTYHQPGGLRLSEALPPRNGDDSWSSRASDVAVSPAETTHV